MAAPIGWQMSELWPLSFLLVPFFYGFVLWLLAKLRR